MYRIRFHGRGGQGMKTAGRILGTAFFREGYEVQDAPRYGAERRGAPIFAFVRADKNPILERGIIRRPDLAVVADDTLAPVPAAGVLAGVDAHTLMLINTHEAAETWRQRLALPGRVLVLPASAEVEDRAALPQVGAACAGAAARLVGVIGRDALERAIRQELGHLGEAVLADNLAVALHAFDLMADEAGSLTERPPQIADAWQPPDWIEIPFEGADISAPAIHGALTSELMQTGLWRTLRPVIDRDRCNRCWWVCSTFCPDSAIRVDGEGNPHIDYDHCKGCLVCLAQCPPHAIRAVPEHSEQGGGA
ncbi:MAG: 2-oxoacid:acceptor oxidoreductase family protein [Gammaproteobacteria bacterium]|nr:2-oxoacid:acceptor oxidoreductase family protein [Gammaproteobacteria bacterium]MBU1653309.1 2-oxoacid:acceptor oxidoreductase family protein [Gammaproteobacteria bacterium]MBU1961063.1 2-oxoacid:acceptor oxidoreductase family protein [Gammaproteobacteria bacterium]